MKGHTPLPLSLSVGAHVPRPFIMLVEVPCATCSDAGSAPGVAGHPA